MATALESDLLIERLLRVIDEGRRTATYKPALLLAIIDAVAAEPGRATISTREIAERVVGLYWPQTRAFPRDDGSAVVPRQISMKSSTVVNAVLELRTAALSAKVIRFHQVKTMLPTAYAAAVEQVEKTFVAEPIPRLQIVGGGSHPFLYLDAWKQDTRVSALRKAHADHITLLPGVADRLVTLGPMLRPLIEMVWTRDVAKWSNIALEEEALHQHLFGSARTTFPKGLSRNLRELQDNACFYCGSTFARKVEVDHFLAWSRWPNDAIENLVLADECNGAKSDHLAADDHLTRWRLRHLTQRADLLDIAVANTWESAPTTTYGLMTSTYGHLPAGTLLWTRGQEFIESTGPIDLESLAP